MDRRSVFAECRTSIAQVHLERSGAHLTAGTAFLVQGGLVTNSHVLRNTQFDVAVIRFDGMDYVDGIRLARETCFGAIAYESPRDEHDAVFLKLEEPEFAGREPLAFGDAVGLQVGDEVGFLGYPFQSPHLACHVGYIACMYRDRRTTVLQIDGSVNGGNSGGPLLDLASGQVVGLVSRSEVGFLADQFDELIETLRQNVDLLTRSRGGISIGGVDPVRGLLASQSAMLAIAKNLRRSANVGIGYAFGTDHLRDRIGALHAGGD